MVRGMSPIFPGEKRSASLWRERWPTPRWPSYSTNQHRRWMRPAKLEVESLLQNIVREHRMTCIVVTHDVAQAARIADRALLLELGRIIRAGPVNEVLH